MRKYDYAQLPEEMKAQKRWVLWKKENREGRMTKLPVNAKTGYLAKSNDENTWVDFKTAFDKYTSEYYRNIEGLGFMLGNGFFGVDIDHAVDSSLEIVTEFVDALNSYTEISQSGDGVHIICKGVLPEGARRKGNIEMYDNVRFFALTGNLYNGEKRALADCTDKIIPLYNKYLLNKKEAPEGAYVFERAVSENHPTFTAPKLSDDEIISKALSSKNAGLFSLLYYGQWQGVYNSQSEADMAFCSLLAFWTGKDPVQMDRIFRTSQLIREKWDAKNGDSTYGRKTIDSAIRMCNEVYIPKRERLESSTYQETKGEPAPKCYDLNDTGNAERFVDMFGENIRYNFDNKCWVIWDGKTWQKDTRQLTKCYADLMIEKMKEEAVKEPDTKIADSLWKNVKHMASNSGKEAMLKEAQHIGVIPTQNKDYDQNAYLLNCNNGVVDLRTGVILPHRREYMLSRNTGIDCDMSGEPTLWVETLTGIFKKSIDMVDYIQKALGYSITGDTKEQCFFQCWGNGSNGKSLFFGVVYNVFGSYALNAQVESILTRGKSNSGNASPDIARMDGARFVRTNEPNEGARFNEGLVKQLTGGDDTITARFLYGQDFEFTPIFKLWIACNYKIVVRGTDKGIWRRQRLIPFTADFEGANDDKERREKLRQEYPKILGWIVKGCLKWQKEGLESPTEVKIATEEYKDEMDIVESWANECLILNKKYREKSGELYQSYERWAREGNEYKMSKTKFGLELSKKFEKTIVNGYVYYCGVQLRSKSTGYVYDEYEAKRK